MGQVVSMNVCFSKEILFEIFEGQGWETGFLDRWEMGIRCRCFEIPIHFQVISFDTDFENDH